MPKSLASLILKFPVAMAVGLLALPAAAAPLSYTGGTYVQNFDTLPSTGSGNASGRGPHELVPVWSGATGLVGWQFANPSGNSSSTEYRAQNGSQSGSSGRGVVSFGSTGSSDRAIGALATSNQISTFGLVLINNTPNDLTSITLSFVGEQWRRGDVSSPNTLAFSYGLGSSIGAGGLTAYAPLNFVSPNTQASPNEVALDGNLAGNQTALSATITGINWGVGESLVLKWTGQDLSGQDDGLAIDNLTFTAVPEPSSLALSVLGLAGIVGMVIRRRRAS